MRVLAPTDENIRVAAEALERGELVVIPTETVYGLAAVATDEAAVRRVFEVKGRPPENPLIVHLASADWVEEVAREFPLTARKLAEAFWPGPLTLVLPKMPIIPYVVTAGLDTVAVRVPFHAIALKLLHVLQRPLAAPSANRFMSLSPTRVQDIDPHVGAQAFCVLDGGDSTIGIESTVVDCTAEPRILRPGGISREQIQTVLKAPLPHVEGAHRKSPGQYPRHYAPRTPILIKDRLDASDAGLTFEEPSNERQVRMPQDPREYAALLYRNLADLDQFGASFIVVQAPPESAAWEAVWDRLRKAATDA